MRNGAINNSTRDSHGCGAYVARDIGCVMRVKVLRQVTSCTSAHLLSGREQKKNPELAVAGTPCFPSRPDALGPEETIPTRSSYRFDSHTCPDKPETPAVGTHRIANRAEAMGTDSNWDDTPTSGTLGRWRSELETWQRRDRHPRFSHCDPYRHASVTKTQQICDIS